LTAAFQGGRRWQVLQSMSAKTTAAKASLIVAPVIMLQHIEARENPLHFLSSEIRFKPTQLGGAC